MDFFEEDPLSIGVIFANIRKFQKLFGTDLERSVSCSSYHNHRETRSSFPMFDGQSWLVVETKAVQEANARDPPRFAPLNKNNSTLPFRLLWGKSPNRVRHGLPLHKGLVQTFQPHKSAFLRMHRNRRRVKIGTLGANPAFGGQAQPTVLQKSDGGSPKSKPLV